MAGSELVAPEQPAASFRRFERGFKDGRNRRSRPHIAQRGVRRRPSQKRLKEMCAAHGQTLVLAAEGEATPDGTGDPESPAKPSQLRGSALELELDVRMKLDPDVSPCPFCRSRTLLLIGGSRLFLYYRCGECTEVWTVTGFSPIKAPAVPEHVRAH